MSYKIKAAVVDPEGHGLDVDFDAASLTVTKAEIQLVRLTTLRAHTSMAIETCRDLLNIAAPERARERYQAARNGQKENT